MTIAEAIKKIAGHRKESGPFIGKVKSVSGNLCTCENVMEGTEIDGIKLSASGENGIILKPKVGSFVMVEHYGHSNYFVSMVSDLDSITMLSGNFGGLVKVDDLVNKLNAIENKVNDIITAFNTHLHTGVTPGIGSSGTTATPVTGALTNTLANDVENTKITHGNA